MILELGLICNVYIVYLILRSFSASSLEEVNLSRPRLKENEDILKDNTTTDYHLTTRRVSKVLLSRITNLVLLSQLAYLLFWWLVTQDLTSGITNMELYLFDGLILLSNNSILFMIIVNIFAFLSYQVLMNGLGSLVAIDGSFINNRFNNINNNTSGLLSGETSLMILGNIIGIDLLLTSNNFIMALISWELINICIYSLISVNNNRTKVLSNSIKYFIISAVSTTIFILGITLIYMETGSFNYNSINYQISMDPSFSDNNVLLLGILFVFFTILLKLGGAPLHFWAPDLYSNQPSNITQWLLIVPKLGNLLFLLNLYTLFGLHNYYTYSNAFLLLVGIISMLVGCMSLLSQVKVKRFFAYSSICHVGFLLLALAFNGYNAYMHYLIIYALTTLSIFIIISIYNNTSLAFLQITSLGNIRTRITALGLFIIFSINLFSLAGMPPLAGFFAKLGVLGTILSDTTANNEGLIPGILVILLFILASIISGLNYLRVISLQLNIRNSNNPEDISKVVNKYNSNSLSILLTQSDSVLYDILSVSTIILVLYIIL